MKSIPCPIAVEDMLHLVRDLKLTDEEIAARIPGGTIKRVCSWRKRLGVGAMPRWARNEVPAIEGRLRSLLVGSMLGDGRLVRRVHATHFMERHCGAQRAYLEWKAGIWGAWAKPITEIPDKRGFLQVGMCTCAHEALNEWQALFYADKQRGWKRLVPQIVDLVDDFALSVWYMDDGYAGWWPMITFGADDASRAVAGSIFDKFGLKPRWDLKVRTTGAFVMEREDAAEKFLGLVQPHVPECMSYKLGPFGFQGPHYQVRRKATPEVLRQMASEGVPIRTIAGRLGVGATTVDRRLVELGIDHPRKIGRPTR